MNEYEQNRQSLSVVLSSEELTSLKEEVNQVFVDPAVASFCLTTRDSNQRTS